MKYGVVLPLILEGKATEPAALIDLAQAAEALGYESIWAQDDATGPGLDALSLIAAVAFATKRVRLGFSILVLPQREALATARALATIDRISGGRLVAGVGVGSERSASAVYTVGSGDRGRLMDEQIDAMRRVWAGEEVAANGRWVRFPRGESPRPAQDPVPIYIGTWGNEGGLRRAVRVGQGWLASGIRTKQERFAASSTRLDDLCVEAGRDPRSIERGFANCPLALADSREAGVAMAAPLLRGGYGIEPEDAGVPLIGTPDDARAVLERVQSLGPDILCVFPQRLDAVMLESFVRDVVGGT